MSAENSTAAMLSEDAKQARGALNRRRLRHVQGTGGYTETCRS